MAEQNDPKQQDTAAPVAPATSSDELTEKELDSIAGAIGGSNGVARTGSGGVTPPPTAPPPSY